MNIIAKNNSMLYFLSILYISVPIHTQYKIEQGSPDDVCTTFYNIIWFLCCVILLYVEL